MDSPDIVEVILEGTSTVVEVEVPGIQGPAGPGSTPVANNTILGNISGATAQPVGLTPAQAKTVLGMTWADILDKPTLFAPSAHTHPIADISGLGSGVAAALALSSNGTGGLLRSFGANLYGPNVNDCLNLYDNTNAEYLCILAESGLVKASSTLIGSKTFAFQEQIKTINGNTLIGTGNIAISSYTLPSMTGQSGKFLTNNGTVESWSNRLGTSPNELELTHDGTYGIVYNRKYTTLDAGRMRLGNNSVLFGAENTAIGMRFAWSDSTNLVTCTMGSDIGAQRANFSAASLATDQVVNLYGGSGRLAFWNPGTTAVDFTVSRNAAGVGQIGTTANNALGSLLLTDLTASGTITAPRLHNTGRLDLIGNTANGIADGVAAVRLGTPKYSRWIDVTNEGWMLFPNGGGVQFASGAVLNVSALAVGAALVLGNNWRLANGGSGILRQVSATTAQTFELYATYTDESNLRRLRFGSTTAGAFSITAEGLGTGASGNTLALDAATTVTVFPNATASERVVISKDGLFSYITASIFTGNTGGSNFGFNSNNQNLTPSALQLVSSSSVHWTNSTTFGTRDVSISRNAAGVLQVGNSTTNNALGSLLLANLTASGVVTTIGGHRIQGSATDFDIVLPNLAEEFVNVKRGAQTLFRLQFDGSTAFRGAVRSNAFTWTNTPSDPVNNGFDTCLTRSSAGVLQLGTTASNALGSLLLTNLTASGTVTSTFQSLSANPTTVDLTAGQSRLVKNTTSGVLSLFANDGGTIKSVPLV